MCLLAYKVNKHAREQHHDYLITREQNFIKHFGEHPQLHARTPQVKKAYCYGNAQF